MAALAVLGGVVGVGLMILNLIFNGYVLSVLWGWFIVPTFGVPALGIAPALGVALVVAYMTYQFHDHKREEDFGEIVFRGFVMGSIKGLLFLFVGWIVHMFM